MHIVRLRINYNQVDRLAKEVKMNDDPLEFLLPIKLVMIIVMKLELVMETEFRASHASYFFYIYGFIGLMIEQKYTHLFIIIYTHIPIHVYINKK